MQGVLLRSNRTSRQQALLESEMAAAREVQQAILPEQVESVPGFTAESEYPPAREVGGDFFQIIPHKTDGSHGTQDDGLWHCGRVFACLPPAAPCKAKAGPALSGCPAQTPRHRATMSSVPSAFARDRQSLPLSHALRLPLGSITKRADEPNSDERTHGRYNRDLTLLLRSGIIQRVLAPGSSAAGNGHVKPRAWARTGFRFKGASLPWSAVRDTATSGRVSRPPSCFRRWSTALTKIDTCTFFP